MQGQHSNNLWTIVFIITFNVVAPFTLTSRLTSAVVAVVVAVAVEAVVWRCLPPELCREN